MTSFFHGAGWPPISTKVSPRPTSLNAEPGDIERYARSPTIQVSRPNEPVLYLGQRYAMVWNELHR